jgi:hypothetical protein
MLSEPTNFYESVARAWARSRVARRCQRLAAIVTMCTFAVWAVSPGLAHAGQEPSPADPTAAPAVASAAPPPPPRVEGSLNLTGTVVWDGLRDRGVRLQFASGAELTGTIVAQDAANLAVARAPDGAVVSVPKSDIVGVQMQASAKSSKPTGQRRLDSGRKQYAGGVVLLGFGVPFGFSGTVMLGLCLPCLSIHLPLLLPGIGMIVGGSIAIRRAKQKNAAFRKDWGIPLASRMQLAPTLSLGRGGGEIGFNLRF